MIYSVKKHKELPVNVQKEVYKTFTRYIVKDGTNTSQNIGYVDLKDSKNGVKVLYIENQQHKLYRQFGTIADQIELEHCINRGINIPYIQSEAASGTLLQHFKRGKRYIDEGINLYLSYLCETLQKGERVFTGFLGSQKMYMPVNMINVLKEKIKIAPLLQEIK